MAYAYSVVMQLQTTDMPILHTGRDTSLHATTKPMVHRIVAHKISCFRVSGRLVGLLGLPHSLFVSDVIGLHRISLYFETLTTCFKDNKGRRWYALEIENAVFQRCHLTREQKTVEEGEARGVISRDVLRVFSIGYCFYQSKKRVKKRQIEAGPT